MNILVMGVSGCGKSTVGEHLAQHFDLPFIEGDDYHPPSNVAKMAAGIPLNDDDREPWLKVLGEVLAKAEKDNGAVLACSALKKKYRDILCKSLHGPLHIVWLDGSRAVLLSRLKTRNNHFFPPHLLDSQLQTLEPPADAIRIDIDQPIEDIRYQAVAKLSGS